MDSNNRTITDRQGVAKGNTVNFPKAAQKRVNVAGRDARWSTKVEEGFV